MKKLIFSAISAIVFFSAIGASALTSTYTNRIDAQSEVDHVFVEILSAGQYEFDFLARETAFSPDFFGNGRWNDRLDLTAYLFSSSGTLIAGNDDNGGLGADGSVSSFDPRFLANLSVGSYVLGVGDYFLAPGDAWDGVNDTLGLCAGGNWMLTLTGENFTLSDTAPTAPVPEPATMFLLGTGLCGLFGIKRRKKA